MIETLDPIAIYRVLTTIATQWERKVLKCEIGENAVYDALIAEGYIITRFPIKEEREISLERKKAKLKEPRFPDAFARYHDDAEPCFESYFFLDPKYKGSQKYLGIVNRNDYVGYVKFLRYFTVLVPFKIFFYLHDVKQIWVHDLRDPHVEPSLESTVTFLSGKKVYHIFHSELEFWKRVYTEQ